MLLCAPSPSLSSTLFYFCRLTAEYISYIGNKTAYLYILRVVTHRLLSNSSISRCVGAHRQETKTDQSIFLIWTQKKKLRYLWICYRIKQIKDFVVFFSSCQYRKNDSFSFVMMTIYFVDIRIYMLKEHICLIKALKLMIIKNNKFCILTKTSYYK